jgi:hypothetical protein
VSRRRAQEDDEGGGTADRDIAELFPLPGRERSGGHQVGSLSSSPAPLEPIPQVMQRWILSASHSTTPLASPRRRGGGGDGGAEEREAAARADGVARPRRHVESDRGARADRRVSADRRTPLAPAAARARWRPVRAAHGLPVEGGAAGVRLRLDDSPALPALGRGRVLRGDLEAPGAGV